MLGEYYKNEAPLAGSNKSSYSFSHQIQVDDVFKSFLFLSLFFFFLPPTPTIFASLTILLQEMAKCLVEPLPFSLYSLPTPKASLLKHTIAAQPSGKPQDPSTAQSSISLNKENSNMLLDALCVATAKEEDAEKNEKSLLYFLNYILSIFLSFSVICLHFFKN
jgi:hypothetical protein